MDSTALWRLALATGVMVASLWLLGTTRAGSGYLAIRWLAGGVALLAFGEMATCCPSTVGSLFGVVVPPLMRSPHCSASIGEFWARRWNVGASQRIFRPCCFAPLARHGAAPALLATFTLSGAAHAALAYLALGRWGISLACGGFFLVQPLLIAAERGMGVRRWRPVAGHVWTLLALGITSPLFTEPAIQAIERGNWGASNSVLRSAGIVLGYIALLSVIVALASLACLHRDGSTTGSDSSGDGGEEAMPKSRQPDIVTGLDR
jgi:hypothetical protein